MATEAAERIRAELERAREENFYPAAWYFYIRCTDVEALVAFVLDRPRRRFVVCSAGVVVMEALP